MIVGNYCLGIVPIVYTLPEVPKVTTYVTDYRRVNLKLSIVPVRL